MPNTFAERPSFATHLECSKSGEHYPADEIHGLSREGAPLLVRYDLPALAAALKPADLAGRAEDFWRYREFLPVRKPADIVSLGEQMTPLLPTSGQRP